MKTKKFFAIISILFILIILNGICINLNKIPNDFYVSYEEIEQSNKDKKFGNFIKLNIDEDSLKTSKEKNKDGEIIVKLFGFIPIKKVKIKLLPDEEVYVGGSAIGLTIRTDGAVVVSDTIVDLENSNITKNNLFKNGDIIKEIGGQKISTLDDVDYALNNVNNENVEIKYLRNNKEKTSIIPLIKNEEGEYKLGLWLKDDFSGVGTLTFVKKNGDFAALGHAISNGNEENIIPLKDGKIYSCSLVNIEKGEKNNPGELKCVFVQKDNRGKLEKNTKVGVFGMVENFDNLVDTNRSAQFGGRFSVKPGKAKIISNVSGISEEYNIEIIKANYQSKSDDKSLVIKVTDKKLLKLTGGIVQGMSGSPILQNGKIVGAVTHVFLNDPTKGYAVYTDWMLEQLEE